MGPTGGDQGPHTHCWPHTMAGTHGVDPQRWLWGFLAESREEGVEIGESEMMLGTQPWDLWGLAWLGLGSRNDGYTLRGLSRSIPSPALPR